MKKTAILVDTAREQLIELEALAEALLNGSITGAAIDSFEPLPQDNPIYKAKDTNLILTPHITWATKEARSRMLDLALQNQLAFQSGTPINVVNP